MNHIKFCLIGLSCWLFSSLAAAESHALLVGISAYPHLPQLEGPIYDVSALKSRLPRWGFKPSNIVTLTDQQATRQRILSELERLRKRSRAGDYLFFYFSGHGTSAQDHATQLPLPHTSGAIAPFDYNPQKNRTAGLIVGKTDLKPRLRQLEKDRQVLVLFDACYSGEAVRSLNHPHKLTARTFDLDEQDDTLENIAVHNYQEGTKPPEPYPYQHVFYLSASSEAQSAHDIDRVNLPYFPTVDNQPHGIFTDAFLRLLDNPTSADKNNDQSLSYHETYLAIREKVGNRNVGPGQEQTPQYLPDMEQDQQQLAQKSLFAIGNISQKDATQTTITLNANAPSWLRPLLIQKRPVTLYLDFAGPRQNPSFKIGQHISFAMKTPQSAYLVLLDIDSQGNATILYPYHPDEMRRTPANQVQYLPSARPNDGIRVTAPVGKDFVVLLGFKQQPSLLPALLKKTIQQNSIAMQALQKLLKQADALTYLTFITRDRS